MYTCVFIYVYMCIYTCASSGALSATGDHVRANPLL